MFLIDTNVISEVRKGRRCDANVAAWYATVRDSDLFVSVLVLGEIRKGVELARSRDPRKADSLERWLERLEKEHAERILPVDSVVAAEWGRMAATRPLPVIDGLLGATAKVYGLTFATRDDAGLGALGVSLLNPFDPTDGTVPPAH
jgi:toxin FitB